MEVSTRRDFFRKLGTLAKSAVIAPFLPRLFGKEFPFIEQAYAFSNSEIYVSRNGTPVTNMSKVIDMAGGIKNFVDENDVVVLKPNLQHPFQGYTHTEATKAIVDIILNMPGGFSGEIIIAENIHTSVDAPVRGWASSPENRVNNWPDMNYNELIAWYHTNGIANVTTAKLIANNYPTISGPSEGQGFVLTDYTISDSLNANGRVCRLYYPIIHSSYSGNLIDTKYGVWKDGGYTGQNVKLIFLPTLNCHGYRFEDYAGATSAVKCHLGFVRSLWNTGDGTYGLHQIGFEHPEGTVPMAVGEAIGELITNIIQPTLYITVAEYSGWGGRNVADGAEHTKTIGLCTNPVAIDYWMGKNVLGPCQDGIYSSYLDPSNDCNWRKTLEGCHVKSVGTLNEAEMLVQVYDHANPPASRADIESMIRQLKDGTATEDEVIDIMESYILWK